MGDKFSCHFNPGLSDEQFRQIGLIILHWGWADVQLIATICSVKTTDALSRQAIVAANATNKKLEIISDALKFKMLDARIGGHLARLKQCVSSFKIPRNLVSHGAVATTQEGHGFVGMQKSSFLSASELDLPVRQAIYFGEVAYRMCQVAIATESNAASLESYLKEMAVPELPR